MELWLVDFVTAIVSCHKISPSPIRYTNGGTHKIWLLFIQQKEKFDPPSADYFFLLVIIQSTIALFDTKRFFIALRSIQKSGIRDWMGGEGSRYQRKSSIHSHRTSHIDKNKLKPPPWPEEPHAHIVVQTPNPRSNENLIYSISQTEIYLCSVYCTHILYFVGWCAAAPQEGTVQISRMSRRKIPLDAAIVNNTKKK